MPGELENAKLGANIRQRRRSVGLTLVELANKSDLSHSFLSQVERGHAQPSLGALSRIAHALGSSQVELMGSEATVELDGNPVSSGSRAMRLAESGATVVDATAGLYGDAVGRLLVAGNAAFTPLHVTSQSTDPGEFNRHDEAEFVFVINGQVLVDGTRSDTVTLAAGESVYIDGGVEHRWASADGARYDLLVVKARPGLR